MYQQIDNQPHYSANYNASPSPARNAIRANQYDHTHCAPPKAGEGYIAGHATEDTRPLTGIAVAEHLGTLAPITTTYRPLPRSQNACNPKGKIQTMSSPSCKQFPKFKATHRHQRGQRT